MVKLDIALYVAAAVATAMAGMLHLMLGPSNLGFSVNTGILFIIGGMAQVFWIIPMIRRWGTPWYVIGIAGTIAFIAIWAITRTPGNPITGRGGGVNPTAITVELFEAAFIGLAAAIIVYESMIKKRPDQTSAPARRSRKIVSILAGIVVVLVLAGLFVLPMTMGRPIAGPQGQRPPGQQEQHPSAQPTAANQTCRLTPSLIEVEDTPQQTEGPYFVDEKLNRSDIRPDPSDGSVQKGVPLSLAIHVYDVDNGTCIPLDGAQVDIWHANSQGLYSDIALAGTEGEKYLRGYQMTDGNGTALFTTIYPGWYEGRAIHIHVKVRTFEGSEKTFEWTSQFYFDNSINDQVHTLAPYSNHGPVEIKNEQDGIYTGASTDGTMQSNTGQYLMLDTTKDGQGYVGTFNIGLDIGKT
jgi:protocatechuate 3,4-dioxygenase beta subunit